MAIVIGAITARATVFDEPDGPGDVLQLQGAYGVHPVVVDGHAYVYVAGILDNGISGFELGADGSLTNRFNVDDSDAPDLQLVGATASATVTIGGETYLYVTGSRADGLSVFHVNSNGTLDNIQNIDDADAPDLQLDGVSGRPVVATLGGVTYLVTSGDDDNGLSVFRVEADGTLTNTGNITDAGPLLLEDVHDVAMLTLGGHTYLYTAAGSHDTPGRGDNGVSVFELLPGGTLASVANVPDTADLLIDDAWSLAVAQAGGNDYLIVSSRRENGLTVFAPQADGTLQGVFTVADSPARGLTQAVGVTTFQLDGETFVAVSGDVESAVTLFHLEADGSLTDVTTLFDTAATGLGYSVENAFAVVGGHPFLLATGYLDGGITSFDLGSGDDRLLGTSEGDLLMGLAGHDRLEGGGGADRLLGGTGNDTYVADGEDEIVERANAGIDTVEARVSYTLGANLENLLLAAGTEDGTGNDLANRLAGNAIANHLEGLAGKDRLLGRAGRDILDGGTGGDRLLGGQGDDDLSGGGGHDVLAGGSGRDHLLGGLGADDLKGGKGADLLDGGGGGDAFVFAKASDSGPSAAQRDRIEGFGSQDTLVLRPIDADRTEGGNQAFHLDDGDGRFEAGEIQVRETKAGTLLLLNLDHDAKAEMSILLVGFGGPLHGSDLLL